MEFSLPYQSKDIQQPTLSSGRIDGSQNIRMTRPVPQRLLVGVIIAALGLGFFVRLISSGDHAIWFDELFSAAIATRPDLPTFIKRCLIELSGPGYYSILWAWLKLAGTSNVALRLPSILFSVAAPLVILIWGHPDRKTRMIWAALAALWFPSIYYADSIRPYSLLILLAVGQTIALAHLLRRPGLPAAMAWSVLSALMILTHYHALIITAVQGFVILCRGRPAIRWQAALPFLPVVVWMGVHLPTILAFTNPKVAWYAPFRTAQILLIPEALLAIPVVSSFLLMTVLGTTIWSFTKHELTIVRDAYKKWDVATALTGVFAVLAVVVMAMIKPSFSPRYLLPFVPSILFGIALWASAWDRRMPIFSTMILSLFLFTTGTQAYNHLAKTAPNPYEAFTFDRASRYIAGAQAKRLVFLWDSPTATTPGIPLYNDVAAFELKRLGHDIPVRSLILSDQRKDPNVILPLEASRPGDAILWVYDRSVHDTLGSRYPAAIDRRDPRWMCKNFGTAPITIFACVRKPGATARRAAPIAAAVARSA